MADKILLWTVLLISQQFDFYIQEFLFFMEFSLQLALDPLGIINPFSSPCNIAKEKH